MLTPKDLVTDSVSGYKHVHRRGSSQKRALAWYAEINHRPGGRVNERAFRGPSRATPLEAAQDYCDYVNAKPITPDDLRDHSNASGYKYVCSAAGGGHPKPYPFWRAQRGAGGGRTTGWQTKFRGAAYANPRDAAQEYCDYVNAQQRPQQPLPAYDPVKIDMGTKGRHAPRREKVTVEREEFKGPHDLYDVLIYTAGGDLVCRKVGITAVHTQRYADVCGTFGMSMEPLNPATTYPSKKAARKAETAYIAKTCSNPAWKRIGKESFYPINPAQSPT